MDSCGYKNHLCVFIDILGYKNLVDQAEESKEPTLIIDTIEKIIQECIIEYIDFKNEGDNKKYSYEIFSDSIIITVLVKDCDNKEEYINHIYYELSLLILIICGIQIRSLMHNIIFRGAVSIGNHYRSEKVMFSKALVNAYNSEKDDAIYPRIIIDTIHNKDEALRSNKLLDSLVYSRLLLKNKNSYFVDYIERIYQLGAISFELSRMYLVQHKELIENNLNLHKANDKVLNKYIWLAKYHNYRVGKRDKELEIYLEDSQECKFEESSKKAPAIFIENEEGTMSILDLKNMKPGDTIYI
jgi:hypothetical protein